LFCFYYLRKGLKFCLERTGGGKIYLPSFFGSSTIRYSFSCGSGSGAFPNKAILNELSTILSIKGVFNSSLLCRFRTGESRGNGTIGRV
jgi:hypothetical protein